MGYLRSIITSALWAEGEVEDVAAGKETRRAWTDRLELKMKDMGRPEWRDIQDAFSHISEEEDSGLFGIVCYYAAYLYFLESRRDDAVNYLMEGIRCLAGTPQENYIARCYNVLGSIAHGQNNLILAVEQYDTALEYADKYHEKVVHSMILSNMADAFYRMGAYERAISCYKECIGEYQNCKDESSGCEYNFLMILSCCGYCLVMGELLDEAQEVADYLGNQLRKREGILIPRLPVYTFFALLCHEKGRQEEADRYMETAIGEVRENISTMSEFKNLLDLLDYLILVKKYDRLEEVLNSVEPQAAIDNNEGLLLQLILLRMEYCSGKMCQREFIRSTRLFFELKEKYEKGENNQVLRMMGLRTRLREMKKKQQVLEHSNLELLYKSLYDRISGLPNRRYLNRHLEKVLEEAEKKQEPLGILFVDIDYFKQLNDRYGHRKGDHCIREVADALKKAVPNEFTARYGGDEFVVVMKNPAREAVCDAARRISEGVLEKGIPNEDSDTADVVTVTIGSVCAVPNKYNRIWDFMKEADEALYEQKKAGKGRFCCRERLGE